MDNFYVRPFSLARDNLGVNAAFTDASLTRDLHPIVARVLVYLSKYCGMSISVGKLREEFREVADLDGILNFLVGDAKILFRSDTLGSGFDAIEVDCDNETIKDILLEVSDAQRDCVMPTDAAGNKLFVIFREQYDESEFRKIYQKAADHGSAAIISAYILGRSLFLDGIYFPGIGMPCHFCFTGFHESYSATLGLEAVTSWFSVMHYLKSEISEFPVVPLARHEIGLAGYLVCDRLKRVLRASMYPSYIDELSQFTQFNFDSGRMQKMATPHWHLCGCINNEW